MTADTNLPGLADELDAAAEGLHVPPSVQSQRNIRAMNAMNKAATALRAASAPDGVVAWRHKHPSHGETFSTVQLCQTDRERGWTETPLYVAPQSFTSGHIAGQREMQERCKAIALSPRFVGVDRVSVTKGPNWTEETGMGALVSSHARQIASAIASLPVSAGETQSDTIIPGTDDMEARHAWLEAKAADMGYVLVPEPEHPDSPHRPSDPSPAPVGDVREAFRLDGLIVAIDRAISNGEGVLGQATLLHEIERNGWMLLDERDPTGTQPNNETLIETIIDAWNDAMVDGMGDFSKYRLEHQLKRHDLVLVDANPCVLGKCASPRTCNDFSECDAKFARSALTAGEKADAVALEHFPANLHPRTADLVKRFAVALAKKLRLAEEKYGFSDGWADNHWEQKCLAHFHSHIEKGDPLDVAAYCAFMRHHGWITSLPATPATSRDRLAREALEEIRDMTDDLRLVDRLAEIEKVATAALQTLGGDQ